MAGDFVQPGRTLTFIAPSGGVTNGVPVLVQNVVVVPNSTVAVGIAFEGDIEGVFTLPKTAGAAWTAGQVLYWDSAAGSFATAQSATARRAGVAAAAALSADTTGNVKLIVVAAAANVA